MVSARQHPLLVQEYFKKELAAGHIVGPLDKSVEVHISYIGDIPKPHQSVKWRVITDLSSSKALV